MRSYDSHLLSTFNYRELTEEAPNKLMFEAKGAHPEFCVTAL